MWPGSKVFPKELFPLGKLPAIAHVMLEMVDAGIKKIVIVVRENNIGAIKALLDPSVPPPANVRNDDLILRFENMIRTARFSFIQQAGAYGNGTPLLDAIAVAHHMPCIYAFADDVVFGENVTAGLIKTFNSSGCPVLAAQAVSPASVSQFGILESARSCHLEYVKRLIEKPSPGCTSSRLASLGRYLITQDVMTALQATSPGRGGEIWLSDAFVRLVGAGSPVSVYRLTRGRWHTVGNPEGFARATRAAVRAQLTAAAA
jgi:UTP--glucose-1-phosphate uridylyltransferase